MIIDGVDPRDTEWELDRPVYRVYFWHQPEAPPGVAQQHVVWHCDEYRLRDAVYVEEVLDWARTTALLCQSRAWMLSTSQPHGSSSPTTS